MVDFAHKYEEVPTLEGGSPPVRSSRSRSSIWHYLCIAILAIGWVGTIVYNHRAPPKENGPLHLYTNTPIPKEVFKPVKVIFDKDPKYMGYSKEVNDEWNLLVAGHDALWVEDPDKYGLGEGIVAPFDHPNTPIPKPRNFYVVSLLHQLHCLNMIRYQYYVEKFQVENDEPLKWKVHVEHCFEYLRQAISCGGDLVIEGESQIRVGHGHATSVTGWGVEHDCIDFDKLLDFQRLQEARYNQTWQNP